MVDANSPADEVAEPLVRCETMLGEGPAWCAREKQLRFVDILGDALYRYSPDTGALARDSMPGMPSFIVPADDGGQIIGCTSVLWHRSADGRLDALCTLPIPAGSRTNDATVDPSGRLWFGTMDIAEQAPDGAIFCWDRGKLTQMWAGAVVTNGPAVTGDGNTLYWCDTSGRRVWRARIGAGPELHEITEFLRFDAEDGYPDGVIVDSEDCVWIAMWDGWGVRRYAPDGRLIARVTLPCARVTKMALGGADLRTAYITTARCGLSDESIAGQPLAGSLFTLRVETPGRALPAVRLA